MTRLLEKEPSDPSHSFWSNRKSRVFRLTRSDENRHDERLWFQVLSRTQLADDEDLVRRGCVTNRTEMRLNACLMKSRTSISGISNRTTGISPRLWPSSIISSSRTTECSRRSNA